MVPRPGQPLELAGPRLLAEPRVSPSPFSQTMARALLARQRLEPSRIYVVSLDVNNSSVESTHRLKGSTYVFTTDASGAVRFHDAFRSSTQPSQADPLKSQWSDGNSDYRFPYVRDGVYPMGTTIYGNTAGFIIGQTPDEPLPAYRDYDMNGKIDDAERRRPTTADLIRIHRSALGSSGCHLIATGEWTRFRELIIGLAAEGRGATYVFERYDAGRLPTARTRVRR